MFLPRDKMLYNIFEIFQNEKYVISSVICFRCFLWTGIFVLQFKYLCIQKKNVLIFYYFDIITSTYSNFKHK